MNEEKDVFDYAVKKMAQILEFKQKLGQKIVFYGEGRKITESVDFKKIIEKLSSFIGFEKLHSILILNNANEKLELEADVSICLLFRMMPRHFCNHPDITKNLYIVKHKDWIILQDLRLVYNLTDIAVVDSFSVKFQRLNNLMRNGS